MAAVLPPQGVSTPLAPTLNTGSSLTSRRTATSNLPGPLELPANSFRTKFNQSLASGTSTYPSHPTSSIGSLLTPPSNIGGESLSPISSGSTTASNPAANGLQPFTPNGGAWPSGSGLTPFINAAPASGGTGTTPQPVSSSQAQSWSSMNFPPPRPCFSPSLQSLMRVGSGGSPSEHQGPSYSELGGLPPFPNTLGQSSSAHSSAPTVAPHQAHQSPRPMGYGISSPGPLSGVPSQASPPASADAGYPGRLPPTPTYYSGSQPSHTPQSSQFPPYSTAASSPGPHALAHSASGSSRLSPVAAPIAQFSRSSYPFGLPPGAIAQAQAQAGNPMMHGMHSPSGHMGMMNGPGGMMGPVFNSGHAAHMQHLYGPGPGGPGGQPAADRPFKCDQCPQSFNRNHDLKRHKRIHLAVKPFPCGHCDKSFSRKDALKRHILVKGCGKPSADGTHKSDSPETKEESSADEDR